MRDLNTEHEDTDDRKYAYEFDYIHRKYMMKALEPFFSGTSALELGCYHGEFSKLILNRFDELTVVDGASNLVEKAKDAFELPLVAEPPATGRAFRLWASKARGEQDQLHQSAWLAHLSARLE